jgi:predicted ATP-grasp superfamily ATP-dependent carboligase
MKILVMGSSARAVAYSVAAAGHEPVALDSFGDSDLRRIAKWRQLDKRNSLSRAACSLDAEGAVFASGVENRPEVIDELESAGVRVFSSSSNSIRRCRDLSELERFCAANGIGRPRTFASQRNIGSPTDGDPTLPCLVKRRRSGAGIGVREWTTGSKLREGEYLQERIEGIPMSAVFLSNGQDAALWGTSRQLAGEASLGADGFAWCGNIMPFCPPGGEGDRLLAELRRIVRAVSSEFGLIGACGADFIYRPDGLSLLEINPRISASFELVELLRGVNAFDLHARALAGEIFPEPAGLLEGPFRGKGIIYAPAKSGKNIEAPDTAAWYNHARRDIPNAGSPLAAGAPICTAITPPLGSDADVMKFLRSEARGVWEECGL